MQFRAGAGIIDRVFTPRALLVLLLLLAGPIARAADRPPADWPQFLGPARSNTVPDPGLAGEWPAGGPPVLWKHDLGSGWSGPVVSGGKLVCFHRVGDKETVECLDAATGKPVWKADYDTAYRDDFGFDNGPRATPAIADGGVYTFGADGMLSRWELATGKRLWQVNTQQDLSADKGFFGRVCSPLVEGDAVILNLGGTAGKAKGAGIAAFDKSSGRLLWNATDHEAGYSSPVAATIDGTRYVFSLTRAGLVCLDPQTGAVHWVHPFRSRSHASVNAASPVVIGRQIFLSASYGVGAQLLDFDPARPKVAWESDDALSAHYATPVYHDGHLYGFHGRQEQGCDFRCVELKTGKVKWSRDHVGAGTVMLVGNELLIQHENGSLIRAEANPAAFTIRMRSPILGPDVRAYPALAGGLYYARDKEHLICVDLRKH